MLECIVLFVLVIVTYHVIIWEITNKKIYEIKQEAIKNCREHGIDLTIGHNEYDGNKPYDVIVKGIRMYSTDISGLIDLHYDHGIEWLIIHMYPMNPEK